MSFFFNDTATTEIYTLSLHDALPILPASEEGRDVEDVALRGGGFFLPRLGDRALRAALGGGEALVEARGDEDRKSTRLNSSHANISYAVFCLKKKKKNTIELQSRSWM